MMFCVVLSVLVCYRSLVQFVVQMEEIKQRWKLGPCKCDRAHYDRTHEPRSSTSHVSRNPRVALAGPMPHRFNTCAMGILRQLYTIDRILCDRTQYDRTQRPRSNVHGADKELRPNAHHRIEHTPNLAAHLILSINRTLCVFIFFHVWEVPLGPQTLCFPLCSPPKLSIIYLMFYFAFN